MNAMETIRNSVKAAVIEKILLISLVIVTNRTVCECHTEVHACAPNPRSETLPSWRYATENKRVC